MELDFDAAEWVGVDFFAGGADYYGGLDAGGGGFAMACVHVGWAVRYAAPLCAELVAVGAGGAVVALVGVEVVLGFMLYVEQYELALFARVGVVYGVLG